MSTKPAAKPAGVGGTVARPSLTRAAGSGQHPLAAAPPSEPVAEVSALRSRPRTAPRTQRKRTTLYVDEAVLRELGQATARLTVERGEPITMTSVLEAALSYGLAHLTEIPADAFPPDARRT